MHISFPASILIFTSCAIAQDAPFYLEPLPPPVWHAYVAKGVDKLVGNWRSVAWMVATPAFEGEYAVSIQITETPKGNQQYTVTFSKASAPFLAPPPPPPPLGSKDTKPSKASIKISRHSKVLPSDLASKVIQAWTDGMKTTRYSGDQSMHVGLDGVSYFFYAGSTYFGQTWCPDHGVSLAMVYFAKTLIAFTLSDQSSSQNHEAEIEKARLALLAQIRLVAK